MSELAAHPQQKKHAAHPLQKKNAPPGWPAHAPLDSADPQSRARTQLGRGPASRGRVLCFAAGAQRVSFVCCGCAASLLTHLLPAASEHPLQKEIQGPRRFFLCCGCASSLTHSLPAARSTHSKKHPQQKKKRRAPAAKKHPQQKM